MGGRDRRVHRSRGSLGQSETRAGGSANFCKLVLGLHGTCAEEGNAAEWKTIACRAGQGWCRGGKTGCRGEEL